MPRLPENFLYFTWHPHSWEAFSCTCTCACIRAHTHTCKHGTHFSLPSSFHFLPGLPFLYSSTKPPFRPDSWAHLYLSVIPQSGVDLKIPWHHPICMGISSSTSRSEMHSPCTWVHRLIWLGLKFYAQCVYQTVADHVVTMRLQ